MDFNVSFVIQGLYFNLALEIFLVGTFWSVIFLTLSIK